jgi:hypothetical protein
VRDPKGGPPTRDTGKIVEVWKKQADGESTTLPLSAISAFRASISSDHRDLPLTGEGANDIFGSKRTIVSEMPALG